MLHSLERRQAVAILEAFAPPQNNEQRTSRALAPRTGEVDYLRAVTRMMAAGTGKARLGIHVGLLIVALAPLWLCGKLKTMAGLALEQRTAILERLTRHPFFAVRDLCLLLKLAAAFALLGTTTVRARSNYDRVEASRGVEPRRALPVLVEPHEDDDRVSEVA